VVTADSALSYTFQWYNAAGAISGATNAAYTATTSDSYYVIVTNAYSCTATSAATVVTVGAIPGAGIAPAGPTTFCSGSNVVLDATTGAGFAYTWYLNGVLITGATGATYTATNAGDYTVLITSGLGCPDSSAPVTITVNPLPTVTVTASGPTIFCSGGSVTLTATADAGDTYQWNTGTTIIVGATDSAYTTGVAGGYYIVVTNSYGCSVNSVTTNVTVNPLPNATITVGGPTTFCEGSNVLLSTSTGAGYIYQWYNNGTPIVGANSASYLATLAGYYTVVIINSGTSCTATTATPVNITVNPLPSPDTITVTGDLVFCPGGSVSLSAPAGSGYTYQWYNSGTPVTGATGISITATTSGNYDVAITSPFGCTATSPVVVVDVTPVPVATVSFSGSPVFCTGGSVTMSVSGVAGDTYQWYNDAVAVAGATSASYTASTTSAITVKITNAGGCSATSVIENITEIGTPRVVSFGGATLCQGNSIILETNISAIGVTYTWQLNGSDIPGGSAGALDAVAGGSYDCIITVPGTCTVTSSPLVLTMYPTPDPTISFDGKAFYTQIGYASYQWYENTTAIAGATTYSLVPTTDGSYLVDVSDSAGCRAYSTSIVLTNLAVANTYANYAIRVYPNPVGDLLFIQAPIRLSARVSGIDGRILISTESTQQVDVSILAPGIYFLELYDDELNRVSVQKITKN